jgi:hypothetical protein
MRFKTILSILCLLGFAAMAQAAPPPQDASTPAAPAASGDLTPDDPSEAVAPDASPDKPGTRGPDTPGTRGAREDAEPLGLTPEEMSSLVNGNAASRTASGLPVNPLRNCVLTGVGCPPEYVTNQEPYLDLR